MGNRPTFFSDINNNNKSEVIDAIKKIHQLLEKQQKICQESSTPQKYLIKTRSAETSHDMGLLAKKPVLGDPDQVMLIEIWNFANSMFKYDTFQYRENNKGSDLTGVLDPDQDFLI